MVVVWFVLITCVITIDFIIARSVAPLLANTGEVPSPTEALIFLIAVEGLFGSLMCLIWFGGGIP